MQIRVKDWKDLKYWALKTKYITEDSEMTSMWIIHIVDGQKNLKPEQKSINDRCSKNIDDKQEYHRSKCHKNV